MSDKRNRNEEEVKVFERFLAGDNDAFNILFRRHNQRLFAYCVKVVRDSAVAEDLTQEAWMRLIRLRSKPDQEVRNHLGLMLRIVRNLCLDHLRSRRDSESLDQLDEKGHPTYSHAELSVGEEIAVRCLEQLSFEYRETLILNIYSGYSLDEIAAMLGKSSDAIWARASRARKKLRDLVTEQLRREEDSLKVLSRYNERERAA